VKKVDIKVLIIGFGSMGRKHYEALKKITNNITVLTKQKKIYCSTIKSIKDIPKLDPEYIVISCETIKHYNFIKYIEKKLKNKIILIEKPIMEKFRVLKLKNNKYFVGYNLRFHPVILFLKKIIQGKNVNFINLNCSSFLPHWRKNIDYSKSNSALKKKGGGLILELSHELDYINWLFGSITPLFRFSKKISNLKIDTDDILIIFGKIKKNININISMNFFSRYNNREIIIDGKDFSIRANILKNQVDIFKNNRKKKMIRWSNFHIKQTFLDEHLAILKKKYSLLCKPHEALATLKFIDKIKEVTI
jgi:CMP-N,N'-diacetyllegionaminic acid synthase